MMNAEGLLELSQDVCFLCEPEAWRVIHEGSHVRVLAGTGPLCLGYAIVASKNHVHTVADLDARTFSEFHVLASRLVTALAHVFGPGYTAYEHAKIGSCLLTEAAGDVSTYCHHAHRVFIPQSVDCFDEVGRYFRNHHPLPDPAGIRALNGAEYVFVESSDGFQPIARHAFTEGAGIQSQFMRRILSRRLGRKDSWDWRLELKLEEMIATTSVLHGEFVGLPPDDAASLSPGVLPVSVSFDGFSHVGKTAVARALGQTTGRPVIDTGLTYRLLAAESLGLLVFSDAQAVALMTGTSDTSYLRTDAVSAAARQIALDHSQRRRAGGVARHVIDSSHPCVVVGRDAWTMVDDGGQHILLEADINTRAWRRALRSAIDLGVHPPLEDIRRELQTDDATDRATLPPTDRTDFFLRNDRRPLKASVIDIASHLGVWHDH